MKFILEKLYKISWLIKKATGYKREGKILKITNDFVPSNNKKIIYSVACHVNANQVIRLIKSIYSEENIYYITLDLKTPIKFYKTIKNHFNDYQNVFLLNKDIEWGRWSQVQVILDIINHALKIDTNWTHFINLSGQDFPLKKQSEIIKELSNQTDFSFLDGKHFPPEHEYSKKIFQQRQWGEKQKKQPRLDLLYPEIKFYKGSQWMILSRNFCNYAINDEFSKELQKSFSKSFIPDESFFLTLAANSPFSNKIIWNNKRFIDWVDGSAHPETITINYLPKITTGEFYFTRKVDDRVDKTIIDELEKRLLS